MNDIPLNERYTLTINEYSQYFHIGVKRLRRLAEMNVGVFSIRCGNRFLIVRPKFEEYLLQNCLIQISFHLQQVVAIPETVRKYTVNPKEVKERMKRPNPEDKQLLSLREASAVFNLSYQKLYQLVLKGDTSFVAYYRTRRLVIRDEFVKFLNSDGNMEKLANAKNRTKKRLEA